MTMTPTAGNDRDRIGAILDRIVAAASAPTALAEARRLFVELLDFAPAVGVLAVAHGTGPRAERLAERGGVHVVSSVLGAPGRVSATDAREVLSLARRELAGDALLVAISSDFAECHLIYPSQVARREELRRMVIRRGEPHRTVSDQLAGVYADLQRHGDVRGALERAFDVEAVTAAFFREYRRVFELVEARIGGVDNVESLRLFAQTLFNRLLFIHFLDRKGFLRLGDERQYLRSLRARSRQAGDASFYEQRLRPLFFDALSREGGSAGDATLEALVGDVPYLNGGLFAQEDLDEQLGITVPDAALDEVIDGLLTRFNFTITEASPADVEVAVDPEMLGKVFEELVTGRQATGSYYTPRPVVAFMCRQALKSYLGEGPAVAKLVDSDDASDISVDAARGLLLRLDNLRAVDPACGSGAYLLGLMQELIRLYQRLDTRAEMTPRDLYDLKLRTIEANLYGVDLDAFAVNIARLRLWLSLVVDFDGPQPPPLPNLDFKIERGDSLLGPDPTGNYQQGLVDAIIQQFRDAKALYLRAHTAERAALEAEVERLRGELAEWANHTPGEGFDWAVEFAEVVSRPTGPGFDIVLANPPYGASVASGLRDRYFPADGGSRQSNDTYGLFLARALQLLAEGGHASFIVSDTWRTLETHRPLRTRLLNSTRIQHVLDLPPWIFRATVNTSIVSFQRQVPPEGHVVVTGDLRGIPTNEWNTLDANLRTIAAGGVDAQTTEYARYTYRQRLPLVHPNAPIFVGSPELFARLMGGGYQRVGDRSDVVVGLQTGDNATYIRKAAGASGGYALVDPDRMVDATGLAGLSPEQRRDGIEPGALGGRNFVPYDKGGESDIEEGWLPNYWVPTNYYIDWSTDAVHRLRTATVADRKRRRGIAVEPADEHQRAAVIRNETYYFKAGITFSDSGVYSPTFRQSAGSVFDQKGSLIVPDATVDRDAMLAVLCSRVVRYILKVFINHTVSAHVDSIKAIPIPEPTLVSPELARLTRDIVGQQQANPRYDFAGEAAEIDDIVATAYGLEPGDVREIALWYVRRYRALADNQGVTDAVAATYAPYLDWANRQLTELGGAALDAVALAVQEGESASREFKETARWDLAENRSNPALELAVVKTVAAFLNADGGTLFIGVSDAREARGLERDYATLRRRPNRDGYEQFLWNLLGQLGRDLMPLVRISFPVVEGHEICALEVAPAPRPVYVRDNGADVLYVRYGNLSQPLPLAEAVTYVLRRFTGATFPRPGAQQ
jgi:hypothetical protein